MVEKFLLILTLWGTVIGQQIQMTTQPAEWGYVNQNAWTGVCKTGKAQSPINIDLSEVETVSFGPLVFSDYDAQGEVDITPNGHTELADGFQNWRQRPSISGGGLPARYLLTQFHFHWDGRDNFGSEHTVDGVHYPLEAHFVHIREDLTADSANVVPGGIAVVAIFFQVATDGQPTVRFPELMIGALQNRGRANITSYSPGNFIPDNNSTFFRYRGSLTTPPCSETVIWTVLTEPNYVTEQDLDLLRNQIASDGELLITNWRHVQPINGRTVYFSNPKAALNSTSSRIGVSLFVVLLLRFILL